ncbi:MAG: ECF transporter S component [Clostridiales bacterium]|jgi:riboflavin transporter FmnP|nr:ECF transporter S component [Clostridiales bacterium]
MKLSTADLVRVAILAAISVPLMLIDFPLPFFVGFLKIDVSDVPAVIATCSIGPFAGLLTELVKNLVKLLIKNDTSGIGELANFLVGASYILPLGIVTSTRNNHRFMTRTHIVQAKRFIFGAVLGTVAMVIASCLLNYFLLIPVYSRILQLPISGIVAMGTAVNPGINSLWTLILLSVAPFNLLKAILVSALGYLLYRVLERFL